MLAGGGGVVVEAERAGDDGGVQAVGLPGNLGAFGVGDTLAEALDDLGEGIRALFSAGQVPEELTREIAVTVGDAA
jgi:hypothetical protein